MTESSERAQQNFEFAVTQIRDVTGCTRVQAEQVVHGISAYVLRTLSDAYGASS